MKNDKKIKYSSVVVAVCVLACGVAALGMYGMSKKGKDTNNNQNTGEIVEIADANQNASPSYSEAKKETQKDLKNDTNTKTPTEQKNKPISEEIDKTKTDTKNQNSSENNGTDDQNKTAPDTKKTTSYALPVAGDIVMGYSDKNPVYDKTLDQYRTNDSVSISANVGDNVRAISDGIVSDVKKDYELGNSVTIDHKNGCFSTYSQLKDNLAVKIGDNVTKGQILGQVESPTKYTSSLGSHLVFKVSVNGESVDPQQYISNK